MIDERTAYIEATLKAYKAGELDTATAVKTLRKRKPNQSKIEGAMEFAQLVIDGRVEEALEKYRFGLKDVRKRHTATVP